MESREIGRLDALTQYSEIAEVGWQVYDRMMIAPDLDLIDQTKAVVLIGRAREIVSQQSALLAGTLGSGRMSQREQQAFVEIAAKRSLLYSLGFSGLEGTMREPYVKLNGIPAYLDFVKLEGAVRDQVRPGELLPPEAGRWRGHHRDALDHLDKLGGQATAEIGNRDAAGRHGTRADPPRRRSPSSALLAVVVTLLVSVRFGRRISAELGALQKAAVDLSDRRLPDTSCGGSARGRRRRRRRDPRPSRCPATPPRSPRSPTRSRRCSRPPSSGGRPSDAPAGRQQGVPQLGPQKPIAVARGSSASSTAWSVQTEDPNLLEQLFGLDHLTSRMRRHAEGLIITVGAAPAAELAGTGRPVRRRPRLVEEVENHLRVDVNVPHHAKLVGPAVTDAIHLIAELVENATIFSPPHTRIAVHGDLAARGFVLEIEDRGLGLSSEEMNAINARLADPPEFDLADSDQARAVRRRAAGQAARHHGQPAALAARRGRRPSC